MRKGYDPLTHDLSVLLSGSTHLESQYYQDLCNQTRPYLYLQYNPEAQLSNMTQGCNDCECGSKCFVDTRVIRTVCQCLDLKLAK